MVRRFGLQVLVTALGLAVLPSAVAINFRTVTVYSVAKGVQYINTADDRARGRANNPLDGAQNNLYPKTFITGNGPFPGDVAVYSLDLYTAATLKRSAGSAVYTCYFNYNRYAFCQAYYLLKTAGTSPGALVAAGPVNFNATGFTIVITGGTQSYLGARGEVVAAAAGRSQRVEIHLLP